MGNELRSSDLAAVREQIGREPTTPFSVVARCAGGHPLVIRNAPRDADGAPFPTMYWLTCPAAVKAVARLESAGWIRTLNERVSADPEFSAGLEAAHREYADERGVDDADARAWAGVGGTREGVKCLHAHYAHHLAGGRDPVGAWVAERVEPVHAEERPGRVAAIDQGTNSIRLLVVEPGVHRGDDPTELARDMVITRLGKGVDETGRIDPDALDRTVRVLDRYARRARALHAERIRVAATSAVRDARNREEFAAAVRTHAGSELEVIDGEREAALSFLGATRGLDPDLGPFLVVDIGGGSTEFVVGTEPTSPHRALSMRMGSVRMTERFVRSDPPAEGDLAAMRSGIRQLVDEAAREIGDEDVNTLIFVAGTATTLEALHLDLPRYDPDLIHRRWLGRGDAERIAQRLANMTNAERAALPVMAPGRGDVIVAGALILVTTMAVLGHDRALVSETDILDGLAFEMLGIR